MGGFIYYAADLVQYNVNVKQNIYNSVTII